jgi:hypothetical protein
MGSNPNPSFSSIVNNLELHPKLKTLLLYSLHNRRIPRGIFDNVSYGYYVTYVKPKLSLALRNKIVKLNVRTYLNETFYQHYHLEIYVSPSYLLYHFEGNIIFKRWRWGETGYTEYWGIRPGSRYDYVFGVDNDRVFVNRVRGAPNTYVNEISITDNVELYTVSDDDMRAVMGYSIDLGDRENVVIDVEPNPAVNVRVQGDLVLSVERLTESTITGYINYDSIADHVQLLVIDVINRILLEHGISTTIARDAVILENIRAKGKKRIAYRDKIANLLAREFKELGEIDVIYGLNILVKDGVFKGFMVRVDTVGYYITVTVERRSWEVGQNPIVSELTKEILEAVEKMPLTSVEFNIGNHYVKINNAKPLSFSYRPRRQPLTLNENTINIVNPLVFIVTPSTTIELIHKEHGIKTIKFKDNYIIGFRHVSVHNDYIAERNKIILKNLEP